MQLQITSTIPAPIYFTEEGLLTDCEDVTLDETCNLDGQILLFSVTVKRAIGGNRQSVVKLPKCYHITSLYIIGNTQLCILTKKWFNAFLFNLFISGSSIIQFLQQLRFSAMRISTSDTACVSGLCVDVGWLTARQCSKITAHIEHKFEAATYDASSIEVTVGEKCGVRIFRKYAAESIMIRCAINRSARKRSRSLHSCYAFTPVKRACISVV